MRLPKSRSTEFLMILRELVPTHNEPKTIRRTVVLSVTIIAYTRDNNFLATRHDNRKNVETQRSAAIPGACVFQMRCSTNLQDL